MNQRPSRWGPPPAGDPSAERQHTHRHASGAEEYSRSEAPRHYEQQPAAPMYDSHRANDESAGVAVDEFGRETQRPGPGGSNPGGIRADDSEGRGYPDALPMDQKEPRPRYSGGGRGGYSVGRGNQEHHNEPPGGRRSGSFHHPRGGGRGGRFNDTGRGRGGRSDGRDRRWNGRGSDYGPPRGEEGGFARESSYGPPRGPEDGFARKEDGPRPSHDDRYAEDGYHRYGEDGRHRDDDYNDEYDGPPRRPQSKPAEREWPPEFEQDSAEFIFDSRSGMFFEPQSNFFYDPKTKLYFSNKKQLYYRFDGESDPPFWPVSGGGDQGQDNSNGQDDATAPTEIKTAAEAKPKIAISLKASGKKKDGNKAAKSIGEMAALEKAKLKKKAKLEKSIQRRNELAQAAAADAPNKRHAKDLDVWSERVKEQQQGGDDSQETQPSAKKIKTTASGQPICVLCRRKFANLEKLELHVKLSTLHRDNLAKKAAEDTARAKRLEAMQPSDTNYKDRSKDRREMHTSLAQGEADLSHAKAVLARSLGETASARPTEEVRPEDTLGGSNMGNKLLQKMGWKSGDALGRNSDGGATSDGLKNDWQRIESLAQHGGRR